MGKEDDRFSLEHADFYSSPERFLAEALNVGLGVCSKDWGKDGNEGYHQHRDESLK